MEGVRNHASLNLYPTTLNTSGPLYYFDVSYSSFCTKILLTEALFGSQRGFVTGGADKAVKFWDFELVKDGNSPQKR